MSQQSTLFNISSLAKKKVAAKRKRKGYQELQPRENNPYKQLLVYTLQVCVAKSFFAPLDRLRFLSQVRDMPNIKSTTGGLAGNSKAMAKKIISEQGTSALWRGNNVNIYRNMSLIILRVSIYDRIKHKYMSLDPSRYGPGSLEYYGRLMSQSAMLIGMTTALVYPLDLIHTRMATDMSKKNQRRLYATTFDCFNRTNIDEGFKEGLYKGWKVAAFSSFFRSMLTLPMIDLIR